MFIRWGFCLLVCSVICIQWVGADKREDLLSEQMQVRQADCLESIQEIARLSRLNLELSPEEEMQRILTILDEVYCRLPHYKESDDLSSNVGVFLQDALQRDASEYVIVDAVTTAIGGKSKDIVFLIKNQQDQLCFVIKAFRYPRLADSKFLPELSALDALSNLKLPQVGSIEPLAVAICRCEEMEYGLLLETAATGKRMDQYIYAAAENPVGSQERQKSLDLARCAFIRMGASLAHLHRTKSTFLQPFSKEAIAKMNQKRIDILNNPFIIECLQNKIDVSDWNAYLDKMINQVEQITNFASFQHGDAHLGNMFYDADQDLFYFIDVAKLHRSLSLQGEPLLDRTVDILRADENLRRKAIGLLSDEEIEVLLTAYYDAYQQVSGRLLDVRLLECYRAYIKMGRLISYSRYINHTDPALRAEEQAIFDKAIEYFHKQIRDKID